MNLNDAVHTTMQKFLDGKLDLKELQKVTEEDILYTPDFFDDLEEQMLEDDAPAEKDDEDED